ncbi:MAG: aminotransferase class V-fold PLP-dependent enzyme [Proteobacteria bacterium]|nr:aminotransferase class V-fold PLP-dependent enzyme [Pseudomonadota bacterium]
MAAACAALPPGPLDEASLQRHVAPLFSRHLAALRGRAYLANHSLGRPLDATAADVAAGLDAWYAAMGGAWDAWSAECDAHRARLATLMGAPRPDCVVPKTSAGQGLRAVLNALPGTPHVVATRGEFDSLDVILRTYAHQRRITLDLVAPDADGHFHAGAIAAALRPGTALVVASEVMFRTGQRLSAIRALADQAHAAGASLLLDVYHSLGVFPVDVAAADVDFAVGGAYKYLRGGPGACFLYVAPRVLDAGLVTLDTGWFAKAAPFTYARPDPPRYGAGGDAWLESTPPVLTFFQARAGIELLAALDVRRVREHNQRLQRSLVAQLAAHGVAAQGGGDDHGAFVVVRAQDAATHAATLGGQGIAVDARGDCLRLCPDLLTTGAELARAAEAVGALARMPRRQSSSS